MTRYRDLADLRKHSEGEWTIADEPAARPAPRVMDARDTQPVRNAPASTPTEHDEQCALFRWAAANEAQYPELSMLAAIPNGGYRPMATAAMLKAEGVKAGYPDILLDVARGRFHGLRIEMKRKPNKPTPEQLDWIDRLRTHGYMALVCYGADEAINAITAYLRLEGGDA